MKPTFHQENPSEDFEPLPNDLEIQNKLLDLLVNDEEFSRAVDQINDHGEYIERRLRDIADEALREQAEETVLDRMWKLEVPRSQMEGIRTEDFKEVLQALSGSVGEAKGIAGKLSANVGSATGSAGIMGGVAAGGVIAGAVLSGVGIPLAGGAVAAMAGAGVAGAFDDSRLAGFRFDRSQLNRIIEELQDSAKRMSDARAELDSLLSQADQEDPEEGPEEWHGTYHQRMREAASEPAPKRRWLRR